MKHLEISLEGMMCEHCVSHVKKALEALGGVDHADVSLEEKKATVYYPDSVSLPREDVLRSVKDAGYLSK